MPEVCRVVGFTDRAFGSGVHHDQASTR